MYLCTLYIAAMQDITENQQRVLAWCREYFERNHQMPTGRAIQQQFGYASQTSAVNILGALEKKGYLARNEAGNYRFTVPVVLSMAVAQT